MLVFLYIWLVYLGSLFERIKSTTRCIRYKIYMRNKDVHHGNQKGEIHANFFKIVRWSKSLIGSIQNLSISPPLTVFLSCTLDSVLGVYKWERVPPYSYHSMPLTKDSIRSYVSYHMGPTSSTKTTSTYYMMLHWGLFPRLTTDLVPQGLDTI